MTPGLSLVLSVASIIGGSGANINNLLTADSSGRLNEHVCGLTLG